MFNTYHAGNQTVKINAVTGAILKNHPKSWFERFHLRSNRADALLQKGARTGVVVLQMVVCGDMEVMAECVNREDFKAALSERSGTSDAN